MGCVSWGDECTVRIDVVRELPEAEWRRFVEEHPAGNIFHTPEMIQVFGRAKGHVPDLWAATQQGRVVALLPILQITTLDTLPRRLTTRSVAYGSLLCAPGAEGQEALPQLLQTYKQRVGRVPLFTELRNLSNMEAIQPILREHGFVYEEHLNYLIDLDRPAEEIMLGIGRRTRKQIRRGLRQGAVVIREVSSQEQMAECYQLLRRSYQAARVHLADRSLFQAAFDLLVPVGMARFTLAYVDQIPVATSLELLYKGVVYGWYSGVDREYTSYVPNELLMWHILEWSAENGYRVYDFGGAGKPDEDYGVRDFKAKFGGQLVCYGRNTCVHAPMALRLSRSGYRIFRQILPYVRAGVGESALRGSDAG
jgi:serine/alanine adding enzyme